MEEEFTAKEVIRKWNQQNAEREGTVFLNVEWNTDAEALRNIDLVIGIVDNWIEDTRFIETCIESGKQVTLLFNSFQDPGNTMTSERDNVKVFRERIQECCRCLEYRGTVELKQRVEEAIGEIS